MGVVCLVMLTRSPGRRKPWREPKPWRRACYEANRRRRRCYRASPNRLCQDRTFEVCELCRIFCGKKLEMAYAGTFLLYYLATLWAYAFVFAEALSTFSPLFGHEACKHDVACTTYRKCAPSFLVY